MEHFIAQYGMPGRPLFLKLGENTCLIGGQPLRGHAIHNTITVAPSLPEGNDLLTIYLLDLITNPEEDFFTAVENIKILQRVKAYLRVGRGSLRGRSSFAHNKFTLIYADRLVPQKIFKGTCPEKRCRKALGLPGGIEAGDKPCPLCRYCLGCVQALFPEPHNSVCHFHN
ncbi:MAG: hypothetical protein BWY89_01180 [Bacteroidetes bacterium ADurb.BinA012]|nr:MAG: hypothetical protein BWY89_01180 [Bacteroidetes bacterium ADurb.BinA012]